LGLPPLSSLNPGFLDLGALMLGERVFVDRGAWALLRAGGSAELRLHPELPELLRSLHRAEVVEVVDFDQLLAGQEQAVIARAESLLASESLGLIALASRQLWMDFLSAPGGEVLPDRIYEMSVMLARRETREAPSDGPRLVGPEGQLFSRAAARFGHDVFDVCAMLAIGETLDAVISDWELYCPIYQALLELDPDLRHIGTPTCLDAKGVLEARARTDLEELPYSALGDRALFSLA
jgi:hypothetical protein